VPARVLYVVDHLSRCGTTDLVESLATHLDRTRFEPRVLCLRAEGEDFPPALRGAQEEGRRRFEALEVSARMLWLPAHGGRWQRLAPLGRLLAEERIAVVHAHSRPADWWSTLAATRSRTPVRLYSRQATYGGMSAPTRLRYALAARLASRVIAVSRAVAGELLRVERVPRRKLELIYDGIDFAPLARVAPAAATRAKLGIPADAPVVGTVATFHARKGHRFLVDAARCLAARHADARYLCVGDGPERPAVERRVAEAGLAARFHFVGYRTDFLDLMAAMDVFVLPSLWEGFNLSLLHACALGLGVVASNVGSNPEIVEDGVIGLLPTPARHAVDATDLDAGALADAIGRFLAEPGLRRAFGAKARAAVVPRYGAPAMAERHAGLYARLLAASRP